MAEIWKRSSDQVLIAFGLGRLIVLLGRIGDAKVAATLHGALTAVLPSDALTPELSETIAGIRRALGDAVFDVVVQPVSTCYVPDLAKVYAEVSRVTKVGGLYVSQHKQPASLQAHIEPATHGYELLEPYYRTGPLPSTPSV